MGDTISRSASGISLTQAVFINSVIWIRSLGDNELNPSRRIVEDLTVMANAGHFAFEERVVRNHADLFSLLKRFFDLSGGVLIGTTEDVHLHF